MSDDASTHDDSSEGGEFTIEFVEHAEGVHEVPKEVPEGLMAGPQGAPPGSDADRLRQLEELNLRQRADFENYRRRAERERAEAGDRARGDLLTEFIPLVDNLDRALSILEREAPAEWCRGLELVHQAFEDTLKRAGAQPIDALGQPFDPHFHDAVSLMEDPGLPDGAVGDVVERGYTYGDRVLRPARVRVNRLGPSPSQE